MTDLGITCDDIVRNAAPAQLYEDSIADDGGVITSSGALATKSHARTGRSPKDKRVVENPESRDDIWWGSVNISLPPESFDANRKRAIDYLNQSKRVYVIDGFAGWDETYRLKIRIVCTRPYHALFMHNMLIRPSQEELAAFGSPDFVIINAGQCLADPETPGLTSSTSVTLNLEAGELVILGTEYAGEMKKGVFTIMNYLMPQRGVLSMHCSANEGGDGDVSLFFGLSGTGKTTLSADPQRQLIGDDEHCWSDDGVFNIEGGCYAKCIDLSKEKEPQIYEAICFGTILENTVQDSTTRDVDFKDGSITENTRASYPIEFIPNAKIPCVASHPKHIIFLTCDAFGVLPPVSQLTSEQAMYHFINGYTAKVAGTEVGVTEPEATFSACFGAAFLAWPPTKYAEMLAEKMQTHDARAWLVNTGWTGGGYGVGERMNLPYTRAIIDAIHAGQLDNVDYERDPVFNLAVPQSCPGCPEELLNPRRAWQDPAAFDAAAQSLLSLFEKNYSKHAAATS
ncbi:MAG: phosphoenolpyruvate carboxykinase (ATP) [Planctomycetes bacterium]|nr:phosphoenolpyruvate carboxykinase (ATP) [Planctomycetota bacterium]